MTSPDPAARYAAEPAPSSSATAAQFAAATAVAAIAASLAGMLVLPGFRWGANRQQRRAMLASPSAQSVVTTLGAVGVTPRVGRAVLAMTLTHSPIPRTTKPAAEGTATRGMQTTNLQRRAAYLVNAGRRVQADVDQRAAARDAGATVVDRPANLTPQPRPIVVPRPDGRPPSPAPTIPGLPPGTPLDPLPGDNGDQLSRELADAIQREKVYWEAHKAAQQKRDDAAKQVDVAAGQFGELLGWYAIMHDGRTTAECRRANGRNFYRSVAPNIGLPGTVHPACRCFAGKAHDTDETVYTVAPINH